MASQTRTRLNKRKRPLKSRPQFQELDTTPTNRHLHSVDEFLMRHQRFTSDANQKAPSDMLDPELDDIDLLSLEVNIKSQITQDKAFPESDTGSLTRRSSPVHPGETPKSIWQFEDDESFSPFSSPKVNTETLPDTAPLPTAAQVAVQQSPQKDHQVDFSETASTIRRSSPFGFGDTLKELWDFRKSPSPLSVAAFSNIHANAENLADTTLIPSTGASPHHLPMAELYDATPHSMKPPRDIDDDKSGQVVEPIISEFNPAKGLRNKKRKRRGDELARENSPLTEPNKGATEIPFDTEAPQHSALPTSKKRADPIMLARSKAKSNKATHQREENSDELQGQAEDANVPPLQADKGKAKRPKQRAKTPIQFDESTNEIKKQTPVNKRNTVTRTPIITALQESVKSSSPPAVEPRKRRAAKSAQTRGNSKTAATPVATYADDEKNNTGKSNTRDGSKLPVIISSDEEDKSIDEDSPFKSPEKRRTSFMERAQGKMMAQLPSIDEAKPEMNQRQTRSKGAVGVGVEGAFNKYPMTPPVNKKENSAANKQDMAASAANDGTIDKGSGAVLLERDPNILTKKPRSPKMNITKSYLNGVIGSTRRRSTVRSLRSGSRRNSMAFSVSERGSPVPAEQAGHVEMLSTEDDQLGSMDGDLPKPVPRPLFARDRRAAPASESPIVLGMSSHRQNIANFDIGAPRHMPNSDNNTSTTWPGKADEFDELRAQILASFSAECAEASNKDQRGDGTEHQNSAGTGKLSSKQGRSGISKQLHDVVDLLTAQLASKEAAAHKVADAFRTSGMQCVERIQSRCLKEQNSLGGIYSRDGARFEQALQKAKGAVEKSHETREKSVSGLDDSLAQRRVMYERASSNLRALHGQLLSGQEVRIGNAEES
ncbi:hypothetical protein PT974_10047 [Cladobotryum mycophilum]|uniref:Uncharacterized protein n=1 Tax=Cladobotryum mycophilum TaxID=491253 RepID=A0ABR0S8R7_9HYPO